MAANTGSYTRAGDPKAMFDEANLYLAQLLQSGKALVDADFNDASYSLLAQLRRIIQNAIGDKSPNAGFRIDQSGSSTTNNFDIKGGDGTDEGAGRIFVAGLPCMLKDDVEFSDGVADSNQRRLMPQATGVAATVLTDSTANWIVDEHAGKTLTPDVDIPATTFTILSNTATTITVTAGDLTAATSPQKFYRVELSTPGGGNRIDEVYLDVFFDEQDEVEDTNFVHTDLVPNQAAGNRLVLRQFIRVKEGAATPAGHTDLDGRVHFTLLIATINRLNADATITTAMLVDERSTFVPGAGSLAVAELDGAPSVAGVNLLRFPNGSLTDQGGGQVDVDFATAVERYLNPGDGVEISGTITFDTIQPDVGGDFELYEQIKGHAAASRGDLAFQGKLAPGQTTIAQIDIAFKGIGASPQHRLQVFVEGTGGPVHDSGLVATPGARAVTTVLAGALSAQPTGEKRYVIRVQATVDNLEQVLASRPYVKEQ